MLQHVHHRLYQQGFDRTGGAFDLDAGSFDWQRVRWHIEVDADLCLVLQSTCTTNCVDKFMKHSERVGARFAEQNAGKYQSSCSRGTSDQSDFYSARSSSNARKVRLQRGTMNEIYIS